MQTQQLPEVQNESGKAEPKKLSDFFRESPLAGVDLDLSRDKNETSGKQFSKLRGVATVKMSTGEIMALTRENE